MQIKTDGLLYQLLASCNDQRLVLECLNFTGNAKTTLFPINFLHSMNISICEKDETCCVERIGSLICSNRTSSAAVPGC